MVMRNQVDIRSSVSWEEEEEEKFTWLYAIGCFW